MFENKENKGNKREGLVSSFFGNMSGGKGYGKGYYREGQLGGDKTQDAMISRMDALQEAVTQMQTFMLEMKREVVSIEQRLSRR